MSRCADIEDIAFIRKFTDVSFPSLLGFGANESTETNCSCCAHCNSILWISLVCWYFKFAKDWLNPRDFRNRVAVCF